MVKITVCKGCEERHKACHDHCEKYKQDRKDAEERKRILSEAQKADFEYADYKRKKHRNRGQI